MVEKKCLICGKEFLVRSDRKNTAEYCSSKCFGTSMKNRIKKLCLVCGKEFLIIPSSSKKFCSVKCHNKFQTGKKRPSFTKEHRRRMGKSKMGEKNHQWKGDEVGVNGIHRWVRRHKGKPQICERCGTAEHLDWANKDHSYKRNLDDYISLCRSCHMKYDIQHGLRRKSRSKK